MSFSYQYGNNPTIDAPRFIVSDTVEENHIFEDSEIMMAYQIIGGVFQSSMFFSGAQGRTLPSYPVSYYRVAAIALDTLANNKAKLAGVLQLLDVKLQNVKDLSAALRDGAASYREQDDNSGSFVIVEQTNTDWSWRDRWLKQYMRQSSGVLI